SMEPGPESDILSVPKLRSSDLLAVKIRGRGNSGIRPHHQRCAAAGGSGNHAQSLALGAHIAGNGRACTDISKIQCAREYGLNHCGTGVEGLPFHVSAVESLFKATGRPPDRGLRMCDVGKIADANRGTLAQSLPTKHGSSKAGDGQCEKSPHTSSLCSSAAAQTWSRWMMVEMACRDSAPVTSKNARDPNTSATLSLKLACVLPANRTKTPAILKTSAMEMSFSRSSFSVST